MSVQRETSDVRVHRQPHGLVTPTQRTAIDARPVLDSVMAQRRITIVNNNNPDHARILIIPHELALAQFLLLATQKLSLQAKRLFLDDGTEITDVEDLHDGDIIYVSSGETFYKYNSKSHTNTVPIYSLAVMGPGSVGKSAITRRFVQGVFVRDYDPTIEDAYRKNAMIDNKQCVLDILDTAGQEDYIALRSTWMRERDGFLLVFSLSDRTTFEALEPFIQQLLTIHEEDAHPPPIILLGNKSDLASERQIQHSEAAQYAAKYMNGVYFECSALNGANINEAFTAVVRHIRKSKKERAKRMRKKSKWCVIL